jgi:hypothetical protein
MSSNHCQKQNHDTSATSREEKIDQKQFEVEGAYKRNAKEL